MQQDSNCGLRSSRDRAQREREENQKNELTFIHEVLLSLDDNLFERKKRQGLLNQQTHQPLGVENKRITVRVTIPDKSVDSSNL